MDRGLFQITAYKTMTASEKTLNNNERVVFANPIKMRNEGKQITGNKHANYTLLGDDGIIKEESYVPRGQEAVVLGMVHVREHMKDVKNGVFTEQVVEESYHDVSLRTDVHHYGKVDRVFVATQNQGTPSKIAKVRFRKVRRPELGDKACLTPDHEVLTSCGWKPIAEVTKKDDVCVLKGDGSIGYEKPIDLIVKDCENEMLYDLHSAKVDLCVTQDHSMWVKHQNQAQYERILAKDIIGKPVFYAKSGKNTNHEFEILSPETAYASLFECTSSLPDWVWSLSQSQAQDVCERLYLEGVYITTTFTLANDVQRLALHAGWSADIHREDAHIVVELNKENNVWVDTKVEQLTSYTGKVYCFEVPSHVFYVRRNGKPVWIGNCSSHGQKGVFGMILPQHEMPFSKDGIVPDLIINPHAFPSRMTIGHLVETVTAKLCCLEGCHGDGTVFLPFDTEKVYDELQEHGYERHGNEILYNGRTGQQIETEIFMGPIFYYRLKHMVSDKVHARGDGPRTQLTHQPTSGRSKMGGLRVGEMERDVLLAHGLAQFTKEHMMEKSDKYRWAVCRHCGVIAKYNPKSFMECMSCNGNDISIIETPYAFKLLVQEMEAMGVQMRLGHTSPPEIDDYESESDDEEEMRGGDGEEGDNEDTGNITEEEHSEEGNNEEEESDDSEDEMERNDTQSDDMQSEEQEPDNRGMESDVEDANNGDIQSEMGSEIESEMGSEYEGENQNNMENAPIEGVQDSTDMMGNVPSIPNEEAANAAETNDSADIGMSQGDQNAVGGGDVKVIYIGDAIAKKTDGGGSFIEDDVTNIVGDTKGAYSPLMFPVQKPTAGVDIFESSSEIDVSDPMQRKFWNLKELGVVGVDDHE